MVNKFPAIHIQRWFYIFLIIHVIAWTLAPTLVRFDLPLDAMEGTTWGHQFEWGYDKNPFMNAWLTAFAVKLDGMSGWGPYLFSQLSIAIAFWAIWRLGKKMLQPLYALIAVLLLEVVQYYNLHAIDFNDNTLEIGLWALTILFFYQSLCKSNGTNWILTGVFAGLSMMTKYYTAMLLIPMGLFLLAYPENRRHLTKTAFFGGVAAFLLIVLPHIVWLFSHDFVTIGYAVDRVSSPPTLWNHIFYPVQFAWQQFETFIPVIVLYVIFLARWRDSFKTLPATSLEKEKTISLFDKRFLLFIGLGPFLLTVLLSAVMGMKLRAAWGQPLLSLWSILLLAWLQPFVTPKRFYRLLMTIFGLLIILVAGYCIALIRADEPSSANYPGKIIGAQLTNEWREKFHTPATVIAGSRWLAGNIAFYSADRPAVYIDWNKQLSPWINEKTLTQTGAIFVWDLSEDREISFEVIKKRFPQVEAAKTLRFAWLRNAAMQPVVIRVAFLPPQNK